MIEYIDTLDENEETNLCETSKATIFDKLILFASSLHARLFSKHMAVANDCSRIEVFLF